MPSKPIPLAKLTRPTAEGLIARERLFAVLDQARRKSAVWISAPAGAGKTSFIASYLESRKLSCLWYQVDAGDANLATFFHYLGRAAQALTPRRKLLPSLTPEYLPSLETFVRRYFRSLFERFKPPYMLVLDNFQEASLDSLLPQVLAYALSEVPPGASILFVSRDDPPPPLARGYANAAVIGWDELKLTQEEALAFTRQYGRKDCMALRPLIEVAQGWAAGLVLLLRAQVEGAATPLMEKQPSKALYDYFAEEIFARIPAGDQNILLKTALLPGITAEAARQITGLDHAPKVLAELHRQRFFTDRHTRSAAVYVYHPLFRGFLLARGREVYSSRQLVLLKRRAAEVLEHSGQIEAAVALLIETEAWDEAAWLVLRQAPGLMEQGRNVVLDDWIGSVPASRRDEDPWLLYWQGMSRMPFSPPTSRLSLEPAFALFKARGDVTGMYLALGAVLSSYYFEWSDFRPVDRWIQELEELLGCHPDFPSPEVEAQFAMGTIALLFRCPQHPLIRKFLQRVLPLLRLCADPRQKCAVASPAILYCLWSGDFAQVGWILAELKAALDMRRLPPLDAISLKVLEACHAYSCAAHGEAFAVIDEAFGIAQVSGVHLLDVHLYVHGAAAALSIGDLDRAAEFLGKIPSVLDPARRSDVALYRLLEFGLALARERLTSPALEATRVIVDDLEETGTPYGTAFARVCLGQFQVELGEHAAARRELAHVKAFAQVMPSPQLLFIALMAEANSHWLTGEDGPALDSLRQALAIGRKQGYVNCHPWWQPKVMSRLFARALEAGIEVKYVREFIRSRDLKPSSPGVENWPWPIRIYTLGRFSVVIEDTPLGFPGKTQKKPLELLKAVLAQGGRSMDRGALTEWLWPGLEGDAGRNAFDLALHRLRKLLWRNDALAVQEGRLTLDARAVWVDAWAFERLCGAMERSKARPAAQGALEVTAGRLLSLYPGAFLAGEDAPWAIGARERLRSKFLRTVSVLGRDLEQADAWEKAAALYRRAIELDPLAEEFHRSLMLSYRAQGRIAEALDAYRRCRDLLSIILGIEPSPQTQAVYRTLKQR